MFFILICNGHLYITFHHYVINKFVNSVKIPNIMYIRLHFVIFALVCADLCELASLCM